MLSVIPSIKDSIAYFSSFKNATAMPCFFISALSPRIYFEIPVFLNTYQRFLLTLI